ncbi:MAG TPA: M1 family aminopeptidase [Chitinophagaceae bacterium]
MKITFVFLLLVSIHSLAQTKIDVQHYRFEVRLTDSSNVVNGTATIRFKAMQKLDTVSFDLINTDTSNRGMTVLNVLSGGRSMKWAHRNNKLHINLSPAVAMGSVMDVRIDYSGNPKDGLVISTNKFGDRTFFGDNWPDRGRNWLPCVDDPADKASVEFLVTAPIHYQVVSNGVQIEETVLNNQEKLTHWKETAALPTKIMVIGVAKFAVQYVGDTLGVPVYSWVYPQEKANAFYDYAQAKDVLPFFINNIGPYAYGKLANVQSKTIFGGMENAGCIFYNENTISGQRKAEDLLAHEIAHQWFGNMATEKSFAHLWLSEGFATYLTDLYMGEKYGKDTMNTRLLDERNQVVVYNRRSPGPVVDSLTKNYMQLLNANSYQKGAWVLHMLRGILGADVFMKGVKTYYKKYAGSNASTDDFRKVMEEVSGKDLKTFFRQWLFTGGHPVLQIKHEFDVKKNAMTVTVTQQQEGLFEFPLEIQFRNGSINVKKTLQIKKKEEKFMVSGVGAKSTLVVDPEVKLLYEVNRGF